MAGDNDTHVQSGFKNTYFSTIASISLVLFMLGILGFILINAKQLSDYVRENVRVQIYLNDDVKNIEIIQFRKKLETESYVKHSEFIHKDSAAQEWIRETGEDFIEFIGHNPLKHHIDLHLFATDANVQKIDEIAAALRGENAELIDDIRYNKGLLTRINRNIEKTTLIMLGFSSMLLIISIALINNTIRLSINSKRLIIKSMRLVGATQSFIRRPFLLRGLLQGIYGALIAIALLTGVMIFLIEEFPFIKRFDQFLPSVGIVFATVVVMGMFISWISTVFAVGKYLRMNSEDLF